MRGTLPSKGHLFILSLVLVPVAYIFTMLMGALLSRVTTSNVDAEASLRVLLDAPFEVRACIFLFMLVCSPLIVRMLYGYSSILFHNTIYSRTLFVVIGTPITLCLIVFIGLFLLLSSFTLSPGGGKQGMNAGLIFLLFVIVVLLLVYKGLGAWLSWKKKKEK